MHRSDEDLRSEARQTTFGDARYGNKAEAFEAFDDQPCNPAVEARPESLIGAVIETRYSRRGALRAGLGVAATTALFGASALTAPTARAQSTAVSSGLAPEAAPGRYAFEEIAGGVDETHHLTPGHEAQVLLRWGDPIFANAPAFDPRNQSEAAQLRQFGYNNDYVGFIPLDAWGEARALLCVNHEYTNEELMFPGLGRQDRAGFKDMTPELIRIEMAAHGGTVVEIERAPDGLWSVVLDSPYNRRITPSKTEMAIDGPAAGHPRMRTSADPTGTRVIGTLNNCAGGITPWGTYLMAEENFHGYFWTDQRDAEGKPQDGLGGDQAASYDRYGLPGGWYAWGTLEERFNVDKEPNEPNRFGWIVEVDPLDPSSTPVKHTALGRFRHEGSECVLAADGRAVVYSGDDGRFEYVYKFVSSKPYRPADRAGAMSLLSEGVLYAARFDADGGLVWLPLTHGEGPLTAENGFDSQAAVMIDARRAADLLGATPMDRPEDVQPRTRLDGDGSFGDGTAYVMLTNNNRRTAGQEDAANPRAENVFGHVIEIREEGGDPAATSGRWEIVVRCGDPQVAEVGAEWSPETSADGWFACPDNAAVDADGRLWISTDQGRGWGRTGKADGFYGLETEGESRGASKLFFRCPVGAELCGPVFSPSGETLFLAVQHPGSDGTRDFAGFERDSTFDDPATRWPDFEDGVPPRPSVLVVRKTGGGKIAV
ncbi:MAG: PhoX family phosphatase [Pseudomonadota bacterium]